MPPAGGLLTVADCRNQLMARRVQQPHPGVPGAQEVARCLGESVQQTLRIALQG
jgi:hypothetical protein